MKNAATRKRLSGGGHKPAAVLEDLVADEITELQIQKLKVSRNYVAKRART
jgi:hypothetical protein